MQKKANGDAIRQFNDAKLEKIIQNSKFMVQN